jgi:FtsP/CotA-like multicopper oxidase with cupredoxin domain
MTVINILVKFSYFNFFLLWFLLVPDQSIVKADFDIGQRKITICGIDNSKINASKSRINHPRLIYPGDKSVYPKIVSNDNRIPAGTMKNGTLELELEVHWGDFFPETDEKPGLRLIAFSEKGKSPSIPGPLIRVVEGTLIRLTVHNTLKDSTLTVYGMQSRPSDVMDSLYLLPGEKKTIAFESGKPGTYLYYAKLGQGINQMLDGEEEQMAGAFIIDPKGGSPKDRVIVINVFSTKIDTAKHAPGWLEALTMNGKSWPNTERFTPAVGDTIRWRIVNASNRNHPMHLHGFYFDVLSKGTMLKDKTFEMEDRSKEVTQFMKKRTTYIMEWVASRPGTWLYHCHLSFHVAPDLRLPGATVYNEKNEPDQHMAGLAIGIQVQPGKTDLISKGEASYLNLYANDFEIGDGYKSSYSLRDKKSDEKVKPSSPLILKQYQSTYITVENKMKTPTSVHWHGLEIDAWADGVPGYSSSDGKTSPIIYPNEKFTYKLSSIRPGSFIYHSHLEDIDQLTRGLYGPIIVIGENETYDPETDHFYIVGHKSSNLQSLKDLEINGMDKLPSKKYKVFEKHRLRLIHIAPFGQLSLGMKKDGEDYTIKTIAKDGADLPLHQQKMIQTSNRMGVGETADFEFEPKTPGNYTLEIKYFNGIVVWKQAILVES